MPTYTVTSVGISLSQLQKNAIAELITEAHHTNTGAPGFFAQVFFKSQELGDHFLGGQQNSNPHIFIHGLIRSGRSEKVKTELMARIVERAAEICSIGKEDIWMYIQDIEAEQMIEYGRVLPAPGLEAAWRDGISDKKIAALNADGVKIS
ncbi:MAG: cis-3-chloroacrylic acid dehalogenase [Magnetovibrio sp.]|nr:cis-3-chloroacrylic acid dehalogenase [Magnetovibrio sp.]|tara:strand:- start:161 stop:610 length:450 start_codon:yes stop_codon:yes gene_type:complete